MNFEEMYGKPYEEYLVEYFDALPSKAKAYIFKNMEKLDFRNFSDMFSYLNYCESPIESILATALYIRTNGELYFEPQMEIECKDKKYYADIAIFGDEYINTFLKENFTLIIECDGYEFHQKTKKQVEKDNEREYNIKMLGYDILRFSGSEIFNDVDLCVDKIINYLQTKGKKDE